MSSQLAWPGLAEADLETRRVINVLAYTKSSGSPYSAQGFESGYHSIEISGRVFKGQREPRARLNVTPYDFAGKSVMDLGCNQGGMLFALSGTIRRGIGVDYDGRMVNAANRIRATRGDHQLDFYVFDLEREPLALLDSLRQEQRVDIVFLLSVCMWISNWREVIDYARSVAPAMLFESNGSDEQQSEQERHLRERYAKVQLLQDSSPDDIHQTRRRLFLCSA